MAGRDQSTGGRRRSLGWQPVLIGWSVSIGIDLFFNAGLFSPLFDQSREPNLLPDQTLFLRIPVAYLGLLIAVALLAWVVDATDVVHIAAGARLGAFAGMASAAIGIVSLWTAIDMTGSFVLAGAAVQVAELTAVGVVLTAFRSSPEPRRIRRLALIGALAAAASGIVIQNLM